MERIFISLGLGIFFALLALILMFSSSFGDIGYWNLIFIPLSMPLAYLTGTGISNPFVLIISAVFSYGLVIYGVISVGSYLLTPKKKVHKRD